MADEKDELDFVLVQVPLTGASGISTNATLMLNEVVKRGYEPESMTSYRAPSPVDGKKATYAAILMRRDPRYHTRGPSYVWKWVATVTPTYNTGTFSDWLITYVQTLGYEHTVTGDDISITLSANLWEHLKREMEKMLMVGDKTMVMRPNEVLLRTNIGFVTISRESEGMPPLQRNTLTVRFRYIEKP